MHSATRYVCSIKGMPVGNRTFVTCDRPVIGVVNQLVWIQGLYIDVCCLVIFGLFIYLFFENLLIPSV